MKDGTVLTKRDHMEQANRSLARLGLAPLDDSEPLAVEQEDEEGGLPFAVAHVWEHFLEIQFPPDSNGFGPRPLTYTEIAAWASLTSCYPTPWEVRCLRALSVEYLKHYSETHNEKSD